MELIFATHNPHKLLEVQALLSQRYKVISLNELGYNREIAETADDLAGNALIKARTVFQEFGKACISDDTGLLVDALNGAPGVYSARYAGPVADAKANMKKLLGEMEGKHNRHAHFKTVVALCHDEGEFLFEGEVAGEILTAPKGGGGFGYDPVFRPNGYTRSFAELPLEVKNAISHRSLAFEKLAAHLMKWPKGLQNG